MKKIICFHGNAPILQFGKKYREHICNPEIALVLKTVVDKIPTDFLLKTINELSSSGREHVYCVHDEDVEIIELYRHFNIFNVWDNPASVENNPHLQGCWVGSACEIDYLFNTVLPWIFD